MGYAGYGVLDPDGELIGWSVHLEKDWMGHVDKLKDVTWANFLNKMEALNQSEAYKAKGYTVRKVVVHVWLEDGDIVSPPMDGGGGPCGPREPDPDFPGGGDGWGPDLSGLLPGTRRNS